MARASRVDDFFAWSDTACEILDDFSSEQFEKMGLLIKLPMQFLDDDVEPLIIEALAATSMLLPDRLMSVRPWEDGTAENLWSHDAQIEELTAHGVAREILEEMYMDGDLVGTFKLPELKKHIDENAPVDKGGRWHRIHGGWQERTVPAALHPRTVPRDQHSNER